MRALLLCAITLTCAIGHAGAKYKHTALTSKDPAITLAEKQWAAAEAERNPRLAAELWETAAQAFADVLDDALSASDKQLAARAAIAATKNAMSSDPRVTTSSVVDLDAEIIPQPVPVPAREQRIVRILELARPFESEIDEVVRMDFLTANIWRRYNHFDKSSPIFLDLITKHPEHEVAEFSANLLLDTYNREQRYDDLISLARKLRADRAFLANKPDLASSVSRIYSQGQTIAARRAADIARETGDRRHFERCAELYLSMLDGFEIPTQTEEIQYNAMLCYSEAGAIDRALALAKLMALHPETQLGRRAEIFTVRLLAQLARFDDAATAGERWLARNVSERDATEILEDVIAWRVGGGDLDRAVRVLDEFTKATSRLPRAKERSNARSTAQAIQLAALLLDDTSPRSRATALRLLRTPPLLSRIHESDAASRLRIARVYATAACPVPLVDGLCTRPRDTKLLAAAERELARIPFPNDGGTLYRLDLHLEAGKISNLAPDYAHLTSSTNAEIRVAARSRLATLAARAKDPREQRAQLDACIDEARASVAGENWLAICERDLAALLATPTAGAPVSAATVGVLSADAPVFSAAVGVPERLPSFKSPIPTSLEMLPTRLAPPNAMRRQLNNP